MKTLRIFGGRKRELHLLVLFGLLSSLLGACGKSGVDTSKLEVVTAPPVVPANTPVPRATATIAQPAATNPVTGEPTAVPTALPPTATPVLPTLPPLKQSVILEPMSWEGQTWNNCAPVSAMMVLSYHGVKLSQADCAKDLRPGSPDPTEPGDKNVDPSELVNFIQKKGLISQVLENGTLEKIQALLSAGVPVIMQQWLYEDDDIAHYRVARGYDLKNGNFIFNDSSADSPKVATTFANQDKLWKSYNRRYMPVWSAQQDSIVKAILGEDADPQKNLQRALSAARSYAATNPKDIDAWRNLGYLAYATNDCKGAIEIWEKNLQPMLKPSESGPYNRFFWYQRWPVSCYNALGNYQQVLKIAPVEIDSTGIYAEMRYEYAVALNALGRKDDAVAQLKKAIIEDLNFQPTYTMLKNLGVAY
jgi:tetratricopeptide (TPR) repeat protein